MTKPNPRDYFQLHFLVLIWGFTAILGLLANSISPLALVFFRTAIAAVGLGAILYFTGRFVRLQGRDRTAVLLVGMVLGFHWLAFFLAARVANASVCLAGMATSSLWTSLLDPIFNKRAVRWVEVMLGFVIMAGLYLIFRFEFDRSLGLLIAIFSAFLAAVFTIFNARFTQKHDYLVLTFYEIIGALGSITVVMVIYWTAFDNQLKIWPQANQWIWIVILALVCTVYAYSQGIKLLRKFTPFTLNLTVNLEPVYGIILAYLIFGESERMNPGFYVGTMVILAAVLLYPMLVKKRE